MHTRRVITSRQTYVSNTASSTRNDDNFARSLVVGVLRIDGWVDITSHTLGELKRPGVGVGVTHDG